MDEQESTEKVTFARKTTKSASAPRKTKASASRKSVANILGRVKLTPLQEEWLEFAKARTPKFVIDLATSTYTQKLIKRIQDKFPILRV